jgi:hypothetical protein
MSLFTVVVNVVGTVYRGRDFYTATTIFRAYYRASRDGLGRAAGREVSLFADGVLHSKYRPLAGNKSRPWWETDQLVESLMRRPDAIAHQRCIDPPYGCSGSATEFNDDESRFEYSVSGLCQNCQDTFWADTPQEKRGRW